MGLGHGGSYLEDVERVLELSYSKRRKEEGV
jgi:hypothetical protein